MGSLAELETFLELSRRLGLLGDSDSLRQLTTRTGQLIRKLRTSLSPPPAPSPESRAPI